MVYATTRRGKNKISTKSKQFRFLMAKGLPLSVVSRGKGGRKQIKRMNTKTRRKR